MGIVEALDGQVSPPEVLYSLAMLEEKGYIAETAPGLSSEAAAFWGVLGVDARRAAERLAATPVSVLSSGGEDAGPLSEALAMAGVVVQEDAALRVVVTRDYLDPELDALNRRALAERSRWMPVKPTGATPWIGPVLRPREGPCWACLAARLRANRPVETYLADHLGHAEAIVPPRALVPASARAALDLAALTVARWIVDGGRGVVDDKLLALDLSRMRVEEHTVVRRPQCPACGDPDLMKKRAEAPIVLEPRPKCFTADGGYRIMTPEATYARFEHVVSPITGVVTSIGPVATRDHPLRPVYGAAFFVCPAPGNLPGFAEFSRTTLGKGCTPAQSRTGALSEAVERYSAVFRGDEARVRASLRELGSAALHPHRLLHFSPTQYAERDERNPKILEPRRRIPLPYDDDRGAFEWTPAWSLTAGERRYLPLAYCYLHVPAQPEERFCSIDPNGHAAGNCLEEAILQGFFELAERDAVGIWWYNRVRRPGVDLRSFDQPYLPAVADHYAAMGYRMWVLDVTTDLGLPAFVALARAEASGRFFVGFGCHVDALLGVQRAVTELNQIFNPTTTARAPWGDHGPSDPTHLFPDEGRPARRREDFPTPSSGNLRDDVLSCVQRAAALGMKTIVLDLTRPDIGLHAVKVVVPGLRHIWPRLGPGRLYDAPVRMGWLERPCAEEELEPNPAGAVAGDGAARGGSARPKSRAGLSHSAARSASAPSPAWSWSTPARTSASWST